MPFPRHLLLEHETLVFDLKPHWIAIIPAIFWGVVSVTASVFAYDFVDDHDWSWGRTAVLAAVGLALLLLTVLPILRWMFTNFVLTTDRIITRRGIVAKQSKEIPLERINDIAFNQTVFERMIGAGDLLIESAGERATRSRLTTACRWPTRTSSAPRASLRPRGRGSSPGSCRRTTARSSRAVARQGSLCSAS